MSIIQIIILTCFFLLAYIFIFYPLLLWILSKIFEKKTIINHSYKPPVTFIIAAHNEANYIADAIESIYNSGYPIELLNVIVGSDGSTDNTINVLKQLQNKYNTLKVLEFNRSGKNFVINQLIKEVETEIVMFMDADLRIKYGNLNNALNKFSDASIGCVMSSLEIIQQTNNDNVGSFGEILYQKLETNIRIFESRIKSNVNSLGTLYGIKIKYFIAYPNDLVCDDLFTILSIVKHRKRVIFCNDSAVTEVRSKSLKGEMQRRIRLVGGGLSTLWQMKRLLMPDYGWSSFFLLSHKLSRYFSPILLISILILTFLNDTSSLFFKVVAIAQLILYFSALMGWLLEKIKIKFFLFRIFVFFISMNVSFLLGIIRFISGGQNSKWERI